MISSWESSSFTNEQIVEINFSAAVESADNDSPWICNSHIPWRYLILWSQPLLALKSSGPPNFAFISRAFSQMNEPEIGSFKLRFYINHGPLAVSRSWFFANFITFLLFIPSPLSIFDAKSVIAWRFFLIS